MVRDAYANYVVQTSLDVVVESEEKRLLLEELNAHSTELVSHLVSRIKPQLAFLREEKPHLSYSITEKLYVRKAHSNQTGSLISGLVAANFYFPSLNRERGEQFCPVLYTK